MDIISDLHSPLSFKPKSDILIIAGDISDDLDLSIKYLDNISKLYKKVLFVDGNHEHVNKYPELYSTNNIYSKIKNLKNDKIVYLPKESYRFKDTMIIGCNGWWDYSEVIDKNYFKKWMPHIDNDIFVKNVKKRAKEEYEYIRYNSQYEINKLSM